MKYSLKDIRLLGDAILYEKSEIVKRDELPGLAETMHAMGDLILQYRKQHGTGRAIAAPQVGILKRIIVLNIDTPVFIINPELFNESKEMIELWDDCMSFPKLLVKVKRHKSCNIKFMDINWEENIWHVEDDLSELLQHEYDHLNGILATQRAINNKSFKIKVI